MINFILLGDNGDEPDTNEDTEAQIATDLGTHAAESVFAKMVEICKTAPTTRAQVAAMGNAIALVQWKIKAMIKACETVNPDFVTLVESLEAAAEKHLGADFAEASRRSAEELGLTKNTAS